MHAFTMAIISIESCNLPAFKTERTKTVLKKPINAILALLIGTPLIRLMMFETIITKTKKPKNKNIFVMKRAFLYVT